MIGQWRNLTRTRVVAGGALAALVVGAVGFDAGITNVGAVGPVPSFPDNIVVFPDRDFVSVEGYSGYGGQTATITVERPGVGIVGSAEALVSGTDVAFEINHPGGYCWGAGTGLLVTPDIRPGDQVTMIVGGEEVGTTTVLDAHASDAVLQPDGVTVVVEGHIGAGIDPANLEQRIIEPELRNTTVGKRDVRALLGPMTPGPSGYESSLTVSGTTFTATYVFTGPDATTAAAIAANAALGERAMTWQVTDPAGNRQGLTIAEFGEAGGPGVGGCPNGPLQSGPPGPTGVVASRNPGSTTVNVAWIPAVPIPGTPAITGYEVTAIDTNPSGTEYTTFGRRISDPNASTTAITGLDPSRDYVVEIVSTSSVGATFPAIPASPGPDAAAPTITPSVPAGSYPLPQVVTLTANEPGVDIYYTLNGTDPIDSAGTTGNAIAYTGPIAINATTTLKFAGFDPSNNASPITTAVYTITNDPTAAKTTIISVTPALESVDVTWAAADPVAPATTITDYLVRVYGAVDAVATVTQVNATDDRTTLTVNGLDANTPYWYTVAAKNDINSNWGPESDRFGPVAPLGPVVANAGPDQSNVPRNTAVQLSGAGSTTGGGVAYQWVQTTDATGSTVMPAGPDRVTLANATSINASFTLPLYVPTMSLAPLHFRLTVSDGVSAPRTDVVTITPRNDTVGITTARWKAGDFRVVGSGAIDGATITLWATINGVTSAVGTAQVTLGAWQVRLRNNAPAVQPSVVYAVSNQGANVGPFTVTG